MDWLTEIFKGSTSEGQYHGKYEDHVYWDEPQRSVDNSSDFDKEEIDWAIALSLSEEDRKGKKVIAEEDTQSHHTEDNGYHHSEEDEQNVKSRLEEDEQYKKSQLEEDEQLAKAIQESLTVDSPPQFDSRNILPPYPFSHPPGYRHYMNPDLVVKCLGTRICAGCYAEIGRGRFLSCMGAVWHPECFRCHACNHPITDHEFAMSGNRPYHKSCHKEHHHPRCDVCSNFIPKNASGLIEYRAHPFWMQKYCPSHERDGTCRCCSCERMEPRDMRYLSLDDGRKLCLECLDSALMDTHECQPLYFEIRSFYEGLNMKVEQEIPLLLVERQALNEAMEGEKNGHHHLPETRGLCLSEEQTVTTVLRRPTIGAGYRIVNLVTEPYRLVRRCEVTAILILYGLPRLLTGSILAHEMMHAWLRLKGYPNLRPEVEEGICQVLGHMWLEAEIYSSSGNDVASSSLPPSSSPISSKKGKRSDFEKKFGEFFKHQIESDASSAYGDGFRQANQAVLKYGLRTTLDHIRMTGTFPV